MSTAGAADSTGGDLKITTTAELIYQLKRAVLDDLRAPELRARLFNIINTAERRQLQLAPLPPARTTPPQQPRPRKRKRLCSAGTQTARQPPPPPRRVPVQCLQCRQTTFKLV